MLVGVGVASFFMVRKYVADTQAKLAQQEQQRLEMEARLEEESAWRSVCVSSIILWLQCIDVNSRPGVSFCKTPLAFGQSRNAFDKRLLPQKHR